MKDKYVLVTTEFGGVFFGRGLAENLPDSIILSEARNCLYWSEDMGGFLGLAKKGPSSSCKIGPDVSNLELFKITSVTDCTEDAVKAWKEAPCVK